MRRLVLIRTFILLVLFTIVLIACRREEEATPLPVPAAVPTEAAAAESGVVAQPTVTETAPPTAAPQPTAGVSSADIDWPPQVVASDPFPGEEMALDGGIAVRFDQAMDHESVEAAWAMEPLVDGAFEWPRDDTVVFQPDNDLKQAQQYRLLLAKSAASQNGMVMKQSVVLALETIGDLEVSQVIPPDGTKNVQADGAITAVFNRPVVPLVSSDQQSNLPQPLIIDPPVEGQGSWVSTSIYRFEPGPEGFAGATTYRVKVDEVLADLSGAVIPAPVSWQFTTESPDVLMVQPANGADLVPPARPISITFNMPMEHGSTEAAVSLQPSAGLTYEWQENDQLLVLKPEGKLALETEYALSVGQTARSTNGQAGLNKGFESSFSTIPFPGVVSTRPGNGALADSWQHGLSIQFASPMDMSTLEDRILIDPAPDKVRYSYNQWIDESNPSNSSFDLYLDFNLEQNTEYVITIPADAADPYGNTLGEDYTWRFTMPGYTPVASFNLPEPLSQLSTSFATDVQVMHRNVSELEVALYDLGLPLDLLGQIYGRDDLSLPPPLRTWTLPLNTTQDEIGITTVPLANGDVLRPGVYYLTVTAPELVDESRYWQNQRHTLIVAGNNLVVKEMPKEVHVWATDLENGQPAGGLNLTLYNRQGALLGTAISNADGFARFDYTPPEGYLDGVIVTSTDPGQADFAVASSSWMGDISPWRMGLNYGYSNPPPLFSYLYTDRPIYRPGDTVYFKGILRESDFGRYALPPEQTLQLTVSPNFYLEEGGLEDTIPVEVNAEGIFSGEYLLPDEMQLGTYNFNLHDETMDLSRSFTVAEYRKPQFQVVLLPTKDEALRGEAVDVQLEATYFFGGSAAGLEVNYSVYEESYQPDVGKPGYSFSDRADFYYRDVGIFGGIGGGTFGAYVTGGSGTTDENGNLTIPLPADLLADVEEGSRRVTVEATVNDITNFPVSANSDVVFHSADGYVGVRPSNYMPLAGTAVGVDLLTVDWSGQAVGGQDIEVVFYQREWERKRTSDYGIYFTEWEAIDTEIERAFLTTDVQGKGEVSFVPQSGGTYLAVATLTDSGGRMQTSSSTMWVIDENFAGWRTDPKQRTMDLVPDKDEYRATETARILVQSPFKEPVLAWLTIERGNLLEQRLISLDGGSTLLDLPISPEYAPNVFVSVTAVKPVTREDDQNPYADIRLGISELLVAPDQFALDVSLTPQEDLLMPGETAVYDVLIRDSDGSPVAADFSLALVDLAVLTLKDDNSPPILQAFYSPQPYRSQVGSGLFVSGEGLEPEIPLEGGGLGGGGGGGEMAEAVGKLDTEEEDEARSDFPDTAFWEASVKTGTDGHAEVEIPLPDSVTTWRLSSKAVTTATKIGQDEVDVVVTLPLLIRPVTPRFFTAGDLVQLGAVVNNNSGSAIKATVSLEANGVTLTGGATQQVNLPAGGSQLVRWEVAVEDLPFADLTFRVQGGGYKDASKPTFGEGPSNLIPIYRYNAQDFAGTAGELDEAGRRVEAVLVPPNVDTERGALQVQLSPSLAAAVIDALEAVEAADYDPACAHVITDRLLPNVATAQAIKQLDLADAELANQLAELIAADIVQLQSLEKRGGGWGWCYSEKSDPWLSAYSLLALAKADALGYDVSALVTNRAQNFVSDQLYLMNEIHSAAEANRQAFFLYVLAESGKDVRAAVDTLYEERRGLLDSYAKALLVLAYEANGVHSTEQQALLANLNDEVIISASGAHWEDTEQDYFNLNSDIRGTAMVIEALSRVEPDNALLPPAVRWLMVGRTAQIWSTNHETAWSIFALSDWMSVSGELDADYGYQTEVNGVTVSAGTFNSANIMQSEAFSVPVSTLLPEETNFVDFQRGEGDGRLYYTMHLNSFINADAVEATSRGVTVARTYYDAACDPETETCEPVEALEAGQQVRVELTIVAQNDLLYAVIEDPIPAGAEGIDPGLNTSASGFTSGVQRTDEDFRHGYWGWHYFNRIEYRDQKVLFRANFLPAGTYQYTYFLQTVIPGEYQVMPTVGYQEFFPEVFGRSDGTLFTITGE